jgi:carbamate kinase
MSKELGTPQPGIALPVEYVGKPPSFGQGIETKLHGAGRFAAGQELVLAHANVPVRMTVSVLQQMLTDRTVKLGDSERVFEQETVLPPASPYGKARNGKKQARGTVVHDNGRTPCAGNPNGGLPPRVQVMKLFKGSLAPAMDREAMVRLHVDESQDIGSGAADAVSGGGRVMQTSSFPGSGESPIFICAGNRAYDSEKITQFRLSMRAFQINSYNDRMRQVIVVALGGNAIQNKGEKGTYGEQLASVTKTMKSLIPIIRDKRYRLVITHGNGPQVGNLLIQQAQAANLLPEMPAAHVWRDEQGQLGYLIQGTLNNLLHKAGSRCVATVVIRRSLTEKARIQEAEHNRSGAVLLRKTRLKKSQKREGIRVTEGTRAADTADCPSPGLKIVEMDTVRELVDKGVLAIASGGGGIPVVEDRGTLSGVDAVIDKDRAAALLAAELKASMLIILTAVEKVCINFGKPDEVSLDSLDTKQASRYMKEGHFAPGSMGPKIEAAIDFLNRSKTGKVIITHAHSLSRALKGESGTVITY